MAGDICETCVYCSFGGHCDVYEKYLTSVELPACGNYNRNPLLTQIEQMSVYAYTLECALVYGFSNKDEVRQLIGGIRERFAPDVDMPEVPTMEVMIDDDNR